MKNDPMTDLGGLAGIRPAPGDKVKIDDYEATFGPIPPRCVGRKGGIALGPLRKGGAMTLLGYTIVDVQEPRRLRLRAPFTVAGRVQIVLAGMPVQHRQVLELEKGLYPMLLVLRLSGINWEAVDAWFEEVTDREVELARKFTAEKARLAAEGVKTRAPAIRRAADVPREERARMFWVADREQAEAWFLLHALKGQTFDVP